MAKYEVIDGVGVITSGTTQIEDYAFQGCENLISVIIFAGIPNFYIFRYISFTNYVDFSNFNILIVFN